MTKEDILEKIKDGKITFGNSYGEGVPVFRIHGDDEIYEFHFARVEGEQYIDAYEEFLSDVGINDVAQEVLDVMESLNAEALQAVREALENEAQPRTVTFGVSWEMYGELTIPLPETVDAGDEDALLAYINDQLNGTKLPDGEYVKASLAVDMENIEVN